MSEKPKYHKLTIRIDEKTNDLLEELHKNTKLSKRDILGFSSQPCIPCQDNEVRVFTKERKTMLIPRGILFNSMMTKHNGYERKK